MVIVGQLTVIIAGLLAVVALAGYICWRLRRLLMPESLYRVSFDDAGITVKHPLGERHTVRWNKIEKVTIRTTDGGPWELDLFWGFHEGAFGPSAVFPGGAPGGQALINSLEKRLPGLSAEQVARAMSSNGNALFVVWESFRILSEPRARASGCLHFRYPAKEPDPPPPKSRASP